MMANLDTSDFHTIQIAKQNISNALHFLEITIDQ